MSRHEELFFLIFDRNIALRHRIALAGWSALIPWENFLVQIEKNVIILL